MRNSIAYGNFAKGFIDNGNTGAPVSQRITAWWNRDQGFVMRSSASVMTGNVAAGNGGEKEVSLVSTAEAEGNSWEGAGGVGGWLVCER